MFWNWSFEIGCCELNVSKKCSENWCFEINVLKKCFELRVSKLNVSNCLELVLIIFYIFITQVLLINQFRKCIRIRRAKSQRKLSIQSRRSKTLKNSQFKHSSLNESQNSSEISFDDCQKKTESNVQVFDGSSIISTSNLNDTYDNFFDNPELFLPSRKQFFLYTIDEHQAQMKRTFTAKKKVSDLSHFTKLSKSDTNLAVIGINWVWAAPFSNLCVKNIVKI